MTVTCRILEAVTVQKLEAFGKDQKLGLSARVADANAPVYARQ